MVFDVLRRCPPATASEARRVGSGEPIAHTDLCQDEAGTRGIRFEVEWGLVGSMRVVPVSIMVWAALRWLYLLFTRPDSVLDGCEDNPPGFFPKLRAPRRLRALWGRHRGSGRDR